MNAFLWPRLAALLLAFTMPATPQADPPAVDETPRMIQIEQKYHMEIVGILRVKKIDYWVFMERQTGAAMDEFPVVIQENGSDHDMEVAMIAAENCAAFYESEIKRAGQ